MQQQQRQCPALGGFRCQEIEPPLGGDREEEEEEDDDDEDEDEDEDEDDGRLAGET